MLNLAYNALLETVGASLVRCFAVQSELHHGSANNVARSDQIKLLVDFIKLEERDAVTNLVLGCKRHDLGQVRVVALVRPVKGLFARDP